MTNPDQGKQVKNSIKVVNMRQSNPCATLQQIGDKVGITRERVRQILKSHGLHTKHYILKKRCNNCGKKVAYINKTGYCQICLPIIHSITLVCDSCGTFFSREQTQIISRAKQSRYKGGIFCSRKCMIKYDYNLPPNQALELRQQGLTVNDIAKELKIPMASLYHILNKANVSLSLSPFSTHRGKFSRYSKQRIRARWLKYLNFTDSEIIEMIHCSASTISRALHTIPIVKPKTNRGGKQ